MILRITSRSAVVLAGLALCGCVERTLKITSDPPGARVLINDEDVGQTPVRFSFLWYGDYDIALRKAGYQTLRTHHRVKPPWYEIAPIDLIAETMIPGTIRDEHVSPTYRLEPAQTPEAESLVKRAVELRSEALFKSADPPHP